MNVKKSIKEIINEAIGNGDSPRGVLKSTIEALIETPEVAEERIYFAKIDEDKAVNFEILSKKRAEMLRRFEDKYDPALSIFPKNFH